MENNKQSLTTTSMMKVEYVTFYETNHETIWLRKFIDDFNIVDSILRPLTIYCNDIVDTNFSLNNKSFAYKKYFDDVKYQFMREKCKHVTCIEHIFMDCILEDTNQRHSSLYVQRLCNQYKFVEVFYCFIV